MFFCGVWNEQTNNEFDAKHRGPHKTARYFYVTAVDAKLYKSPRRSSSMVACEYVGRLSV